MRVRPFFWFLLAVSCIGVLIFASAVQLHIPAAMHVQLTQSAPTAVDLTTVELSLSDLEGQPIEEANISSIAQMTNMRMVAHPRSVRYMGQGRYVAQLQLYMAGPWAITVQVHADGFDPLSQRLLVQVQ